MAIYGLRREPPPRAEPYALCLCGHQTLTHVSMTGSCPCGCPIYREAAGAHTVHAIAQARKSAGLMHAEEDCAPWDRAELDRLMEKVF